MSKLLDRAEAVVNTIAGILVGFFINLVVLPMLGIHMDMNKATVVTAVYVVVSYLRAYTIRRGFRWAENRPTYRCKFCGEWFRTYIQRKDHEWQAHK